MFEVGAALGTFGLALARAAAGEQLGEKVSK